MANLFNVPQYDPTLDRENMQINAGLVQNLGAQVRSDLTAIQTNRQLSKLAEGLQGLNVQADDFGQKAVGLMMQYPLAAKSPIGTAAIQQLGAQHKLWQEEQATNALFGRQIGLATLNNYQNNRPFGSKPMTRPEAEAVAKGLPIPSVEPDLPTGGATVTPSIPTAKPGAPALDVTQNPLAPIPNDVAGLGASGALGPMGGIGALGAFGPMGSTWEAATQAAPSIPASNGQAVDHSIPTAPKTVAQQLAEYRLSLQDIQPRITEKAAEALYKQKVSDLTKASTSTTKGSTYTDNTGQLLVRNTDGKYSPAVRDDGTPVIGHVPGSMAPETAANILADNARQDLAKKEKSLEVLHKELESLRMGTGPDFPRDKDGKVTSTDPKDMVAWVPDEKTGQWRQNPVSPSTVKKWKELNDTIARLSTEIQKASGGLPVSRVGAGAAVAAPALRTPPANVVDKAFLESGDDMAKFQEILKSQGYAY